ncbi:MAG: enoyl-CoA hydratase/isomerase family protein [Chloroflexi bacterium]|nr:enoyl-CoA hydratase/isomerase family protein [Chloroflexota bacterium]
MADYEDIVWETDGPVAICRLNRPEKLNAMRSQTTQEMYDAWRGFNADKSLKVMIITGTGRGFTSGADVTHMGEAQEDPGATPGLASPAPRMLKSIVEKPVIGAINGACAGMGYVLALACDIRIASNQALFHHVYLRRALVTSGETWYLPRLIGLGEAIYHIFAADTIDADEALRLHLVSRVVPHDQLMDEAMKFAQELATRPPNAMKYAKKAIYKGLNLNLEDAMEYVGYTRAANLNSGEAAEGFRAFREKRAPNW